MKNKLWFLSTWLWLLALAVLITIYLAWLFYPLEANWLDLENTVYLSQKTIVYNFNILMGYLTNPLQMHLHLPAFSSSKSGLKHFHDVKLLFHTTQALFIILLLPSWRFFRQTRKESSLFVFEKLFMGAAALPLVAAVFALLIGFDHFFTLFHQVLFPGDSSWLFNPATDPVIWILPQDFFMHCFLLFLALYEALMISLVGISRRQLAQRRQRKETQ
ncbi:TIGR01906 family membrane protein [Streptococcus pantholopis]|uniref:TIGR01906 family membrane protein n=1 Tax=Streptococcus pantholopis TaxID=1811193 RepID=A0A172Q7W7_9STRE|nr:hypothetical protein A0O21_05615 [Streptococcus pantholopis]